MLLTPKSEPIILLRVGKINMVGPKLHLRRLPREPWTEALQLPAASSQLHVTVLLTEQRCRTGRWIHLMAFQEQLPCPLLTFILGSHTVIVSLNSAFAFCHEAAHYGENYHGFCRHVPTSPWRAFWCYLHPLQPKCSIKSNSLFQSDSVFSLQVLPGITCITVWLLRSCIMITKHHTSAAVFTVPAHQWAVLADRQTSGQVLLSVHLGQQVL